MTQPRGTARNPPVPLTSAGQASLLADATQRFADASGSADDLLDQIAERLATILGERCTVQLLSEDGRWLQKPAYYDTDPVVGPVIAQRLAVAPLHLDDYPLVREVVRSGETRLLPKFSPEEIPVDVDRAIYDLGVRSVLLLPLRCQGTTLGVAVLTRRLAYGPPYEERDRLLAEELVARAALAVANLRLRKTLEAEQAERRRLESVLRQTVEKLHDAQRLEAVGRMAGGVAHNLNNALSVVLSYADLLTHRLVPGDEGREDLDEVRAAGERAAELTRELLSFVRAPGVRERLAAPTPRPAHVSGGTEPAGRTVLVVEDEVHVRRATLAVLERGGYRVLEAAGPAEALALAEQRSKPVDLLLCDLLMPGGDGRTVASTLQARWPEMRVLLMSGQLDQNLTAGLDPSWLLSKPLRSDVLLDRVAQAFEEPAHPLPPLDAHPPEIEPALPPQGRGVLVIEDDPQFGQWLVRVLRDTGLQAELAEDAARGSALALMRRHDLIVLDVRLPDGNGLQLLEQWRGRLSVPVVVLTGDPSVEARLRAFGLGAVDFVAKPVAREELIARVQAHLRVVDAAPHRCLRWSEAVLDLDARTVQVAGSDVPLTPHEFNVLAWLVERPGRAVSRREVAEGALPLEGDRRDRTVDTHVARLRKKLGHSGLNIATVWGTGYRFDPDRPAQ